MAVQMSLPKMTPLDVGILKGTIYDFAAVGDELPMHEHGPNEIHISVMTKGRILSKGEGWERELVPGTLVKYHVGQKHCFIAMEPDSRVVNIIYGGGGVERSTGP